MSTCQDTHSPVKTVQDAMLGRMDIDFTSDGTCSGQEDFFFADRVCPE